MVPRPWFFGKTMTVMVCIHVGMRRYYSSSARLSISCRIRADFRTAVLLCGATAQSEHVLFLMTRKQFSVSNSLHGPSKGWKGNLTSLYPSRQIGPGYLRWQRRCPVCRIPEQGEWGWRSRLCLLFLYTPISFTIKVLLKIKIHCDFNYL